MVSRPVRSRERRARSYFAPVGKLEPLNVVFGGSPGLGGLSFTEPPVSKGCTPLTAYVVRIVGDGFPA